MFSQGCLSLGFKPRRAAREHILSFTSYITISITPVWHLHRLFKVKQTVCQCAVRISWILGGHILHRTCGLWGRREFSYLLSFIHRGLVLLLTHRWQLFFFIPIAYKAFSWIGHVNVFCLPTSSESTVIIFCLADKGQNPLLS